MVISWLKLLLCISLLWMINGLLIKKIRQLHTTEVLFALLAGILVGPTGKVITPHEFGDTHSLLEWSCKITIALALSSSALKLSHKFIRNHASLLSTVVFAGMLLMAVSATLLFKASMTISWTAAILLGWIVSPTDPVVTATVVNGEKAKKLIPASMRKTVLFESGINDGLAAPMVILAYSIWGIKDTDAAHWLLQVVGYENLLAAVIAYALGFVAGRLMHRAHKADYMNKEALLSYSLALTFTIFAGLELLKMNSIIGVFVANLGLSRKLSSHEDIEEEKVQATMERLFTIPVFFLLGLLIPWREWLAFGWPLLIAAILIVLFRRLPAFILLKALFGKPATLPAAAWLGWIGPIGVAALLYALMTEKHSGYMDAWPVVSFVVTTSVLLHGCTSLLAAQWYAKITSQNKDAKET